MSLINDPSFLDRDLGSTNGCVVRFVYSTNTKSIILSCTGTIAVNYLYTPAGERKTDEYTDIDKQEILIDTLEGTPVYIIGSVTYLKAATPLDTIDIRSLRSLESLDLSGLTTLTGINIFGCRKLESLNLSGCTSLQTLNLSENTELQTLDLSGCTHLVALNLETNKKLLAVDLTNCSALSYLDATMLTELQSLKLDGTQLMSPDNTLLLIQACYGGDVIAAKEAADRAEATLKELKHAIEDLPDGQAVSVKVAEHTVALSKLHILTVDEMDTLGNYCTSLADLSEKYSIINLTWTDAGKTVVCATILPSTDSEHGWLYEFQEGWRICKMNAYEFYPENDFLDLASYMDGHSSRLATKEEIGERANLITEAKSNIVAAVNEVSGKVIELEGQVLYLSDEVLKNQGIQNKNVYCGSDTSIGQVGEIVDSESGNAFAAVVDLTDTLKISFLGRKWSGAYGIAFFNENDVVLYSLVYNTILTDILEPLSFDVPNGAKYAHVSLSSDRNVTLSKIDSNAKEKIAANAEQISLIKTQIGDYVAEDVTETLENQGVQYKNVYCGSDTSIGQVGEIVDSTSGNAFAATLAFNGDEVSIEYYINRWVGDYGIAFFDKDNVVIESFIYKNVVSTSQTFTFSVPKGARYAHISLNKVNRTIVVTRKTTIASDIEQLKRRPTPTTDIYKMIGSPIPYVSDLDTTGLELFGSVDAIYGAFDALVSQYPNWLKREADIGMDATNTYGIRHYSLRFQHPNVNPQRDLTGDNLWDDAIFKPRHLLLNMGVHPLEKPSVLGGYLAIKELLDSNDDWARFIKSNFVIDIVPCNNPWGYVNNSNENANGINLNRDYDNAEKQSETMAMIGLIQSLLPKGLVGIVDCHNCNYQNGGYLVAKTTYAKYNLYARLAQQIQSLLYNELNVVFGTTQDNHFHLWNADGNNGQLHQYADSLGLLGCTFEIANSKGVQGALLTKTIAINLLATFGGNN